MYTPDKSDDGHPSYPVLDTVTKIRVYHFVARETEI